MIYRMEAQFMGPGKVNNNHINQVARWKATKASCSGTSLQCFLNIPAGSYKQKLLARSKTNRSLAPSTNSIEGRVANKMPL